MTYAIWIDELRKDDIALAGGKGANLGELSRAGLPVPPGFVVTTGAYDAFVEAGRLRDEILALASRAEDPIAFGSAAEKIRALFARTAIPENLAEEIRAAYGTLADKDGAAVAARSSATAEDLPGASFAGQQETYLNVRGEAALLEAVRGCWASLWTARAMAYRQNQEIDHASVSLAVVVQQMVESEAAGILFTADPVSGRRDRTIISAAWGLGEAVVGGRVAPDTLVVDSSNERVISREIADKEVMTLYTEDGTAERPVPAERRREPVLGDAESLDLARYGARIEELYGRRRTSSGRWSMASTLSCRRVRSRRCPRSGPRPTGGFQTRRASTRAAASSSFCRTRSLRYSPPSRPSRSPGRSERYSTSYSARAS